jgi:biotin transport system substrate-specific component
MTFLPSDTLASRIGSRWTLTHRQQEMLWVLLGNLMLVASAKVQVPMWPVPTTLQTLVVLMLPLALGRWLGSATIALYLAEGALGLPVFAGGQAGIPYILGPTGGYLTGFWASAVLLGWWGEQSRSRSVTGATWGMLFGHALIYALGVLWLSQFVGWDQVLELGVYPFVLGDVMKVAVGATALPWLWKKLG